MAKTTQTTESGAKVGVVQKCKDALHTCKEKVTSFFSSDNISKTVKSVQNGVDDITNQVKNLVPESTRDQIGKQIGSVVSAKTGVNVNALMEQKDVANQFLNAAADGNLAGAVTDFGKRELERRTAAAAVQTSGHSPA